MTDFAMESQSFEIAGFGSTPIPAKLTLHGGIGLSVFLPGLRYTNDGPLLYFTQKLLAERGYDVLTVNYRYPDSAAFIGASELEKGVWLKADAEAIMSTIFGLRGMCRLVIVGKSIGTALMAHLVPQLSYHHTAQLVWLTPLLKGSSEFLRMPECRQASFLAIGTADPGYDADVVARLADQGQTVQVFEGLDHGLEKPGSVSASVAALAGLLAALDQWIIP